MQLSWGNGEGVRTFGRTALHLASAQGHKEVIQELIKAGAVVDKQDEHGNTALHEAVWRGFSETTEILCRARANAYIRNKGSFAPLHLVSQNGHNQSCRILLLSGCKPDIKNDYGDIAIHTAARYGHAGVMRILISAKANVNECNKNGDTGLHIAAAMGKRKLTKILLECGCDKNIKNKQGETSIDIAKRKNHYEVEQILMNPPPRVVEKPEIEGLKNNKKRCKESGTSKDSKDGSICRDRHKKNKKGHKVKFEDEKVKHHKKCIYKDQHDVVSPYGCHYSPSLTTFPQPKLDSLPVDPLQKGEQYFLDLAGNIRKGPVGVGYACYCIPFFQQVEKKLEADKLELMDHIDTAHDDLDAKISSLERRTRSQLFNLTQNMKEKLAGEKTDCLERVERRTLKERLELEKQQEVAADYIKTELKSWVQSKIDHLKRIQNPISNFNLRRSIMKPDKKELGDILVRSRSEELLSENSPRQQNNFNESRESWVDYRNLGAIPKYSTKSWRRKWTYSEIRVSGYGSRVTPNGTDVYGHTTSIGNQPDILSIRPVISHNTVGLPNGDLNHGKYANIPEPEFRITRQFFDTVSNQMEKWYERRLSNMEKKSEEKTEYNHVAMRNRIHAIEQKLTDLKPASENDTSASLV
ncbi:Ankyrin repeat domain-containing protein 6 [Nymphon striatum]|nr:Ankyrin repeat domain-containing protein 6 [Nymphon striatum]